MHFWILHCPFVVKFETRHAEDKTPASFNIVFPLSELIKKQQKKNSLSVNVLLKDNLYHLKEENQVSTSF